LHQAENFLPRPEPKSSPDTFWFHVVQLVNTIYKQFFKHYQSEIVPHLNADSNTLTIVETRWREVTRSVEELLHLGLEKTLMATLKYAARLLTKQKNSNYKPKDDSSLLDENKICTSVCELISSQFEAVLNNLDGKNLDQYLTVLGTKFHQLVMTQLKKSTISQPGAGMLAKDIKMYQECVRAFNLTQVDELFQELWLLSRLYFVPAEELRSFFNENRQLLTLGKDALHEYVKLRADYSQHKTKLIAQLS